MHAIDMVSHIRVPAIQRPFWQKEYIYDAKTEIVL